MEFRFFEPQPYEPDTTLKRDGMKGDFNRRCHHLTHVRKELQHLPGNLENQCLHPVGNLLFHLSSHNYGCVPKGHKSMFDLLWFMDNLELVSFPNKPYTTYPVDLISSLVESKAVSFGVRLSTNRTTKKPDACSHQHRGVASKRPPPMF